MAWILKIFAIELRVISSMGHMNKLEDLVKLFLYNGPADFSKRKGPNVRKLINGGKRPDMGVNSIFCNRWVTGWVKLQRKRLRR